MWNAKLDKAQAGIKIAGRNINNSDTQMMPLKEPLDEAERGESKAGLNLIIGKEKNKTNIMASSHIFLANRMGKVEIVSDFIFLGSKITVNGGCSQEIKRHLLPGWKLWQT